MCRANRLWMSLVMLITLALPYTVMAGTSLQIPILCYHNLNPVKPGSMNLTPDKFETQMKWLKDNGFTFIPLKDAVAYLQGKRDTLPPKPIVITADDGWQSVDTYMYPIIKKYNIPVTLFIYPETISSGKNAMTWETLQKLDQTGLFDIQSHTYSHPNFKLEKRHFSSAKFESNVAMELTKSKRILEEKLGHPVTLLAWPFGIYDSYLEAQAAKAGYDMAFTIDYRTANRDHRAMAQPRFMIIDAESMKTFASIANGSIH